jgi:predicted N-acetyltransferase YhbS
MEIEIRKGQARDIPAIYELVKELAIYEKEPEAVTATIDDYHKLFNSKLYSFLVAEAENEIVGTAIFYDTFSTWKGKMLYLEDFVVRQSKRKSGIGQRIWDQLIVEAEERKCKLIKWQVLDWNTPAILFYEKNKAIIEKEWWNGKIILTE